MSFPFPIPEKCKIDVLVEEIQNANQEKMQYKFQQDPICPIQFQFSTFLANSAVKDSTLFDSLLNQNEHIHNIRGQVCSKNQCDVKSQNKKLTKTDLKNTIANFKNCFKQFAQRGGDEIQSQALRVLIQCESVNAKMYEEIFKDPELLEFNAKIFNSRFLKREIQLGRMERRSTRSHFYKIRVLRNMFLEMSSKIGKQDFKAQ